jgi:hypothetical protein
VTDGGAVVHAASTTVTSTPHRVIPLQNFMPQPPYVDALELGALWKHAGGPSPVRPPAGYS